MRIPSERDFSKTTILTTAITFITVLPSVASTLSVTYSSYYAFGDSLTDEGKLNGIIPFAHPSDEGRFSNGPVWAETIAAQFSAARKQALNLAIAGVTATGPDTTGPTRLSTLSGQVGQFGDTFGLGHILSGENPLVSVWMGANDLFSILDPVIGTAFNATGAAQAVEANIRAIAALGNEFDDFVVLNLPDLGKTPAFSTLRGDPNGVEPAAMYASLLTAQFNAQLELSIDALRNDGLNVTSFDTKTLFDQILNGSIEGDFAAFDGLNLRHPCTISLSNPDGAACSDPDNFLFVDAVHPNQIVHKFITGRVPQAVSPVPLPAGAPLILAGIAAFGLVRQRRARSALQEEVAI